MLSKVVEKMKQNAFKNPSATVVQTNLESTTSSDLITFNFSYTKLQETIDYLLSQNKAHETAISEIITRLGNLMQEMPTPEFYVFLSIAQNRQN